MALHLISNVLTSGSLLPLKRIFFCILVFMTLVLLVSVKIKQTNPTPSIIKSNPYPHEIQDIFLMCAENYSDYRKITENNNSNNSIIYFVTPTYPRPEQYAELTRLGHTLMHIPKLHWLVANDFPACDKYLNIFLNKFEIPFTHIASPMPEIFQDMQQQPRGVANRRAALLWLRLRNITNGILYFGDDDNVYDLKLFSEIRQTQRVSMFPVGFIGCYAVSSPFVQEGKVTGFFDSWPADRLFALDMAGFAINLAYLADYPNATMPFECGYEEDFFLQSINLTLDFIEPLANNCTEILVWHTRTRKNAVKTISLQTSFYDDRYNFGALFQRLINMMISRVSERKRVKPNFVSIIEEK